MPSLMETIMGQLGGDALKKISGTLGTDEKKAGAATGTAVAAILGALSRNAAKPSGAAALSGALSRDHDGSVMDNLGSLFARPETGAGEGILKHVLGDRSPVVASGLGKANGLDAGSMGKLLAMVAPLVMGALGREQRQKGMDPAALAGMLSQERSTLERQQPQAMGAFSALLDADGDGDVDMQDIARQAKGLFGKLLGGK